MPAPHIFLGDSLTHYSSWPDPLTIISDGAYGIGGFSGDPTTPDALPGWYEPHVRVWSDRSNPQTTLWFWNTEVGWASVHPLLVAYGWVYEQLVTWDKGIGHVAGNVNSRTIRSLPVVTEVCARYTRPPVLYKDGGTSVPSNMAAGGVGPDRSPSPGGQHGVRREGCGHPQISRD